MRGFALVVLVAASGACGPKAAPETAPPSSPSAPEPAPVVSARMVNATVLANGCRELGPSSARLAESAMYRLIEGCSSVPGGKAEFSATLQPGGRVEITSASGKEDVVPICVLKHSLSHSVPLTRPCRLDVKLEQSSVPMPVDAGSG